MSDSNYPAGVSNKDFDFKTERKIYEITIDDLIYDNGHGEHGACLVVEVDCDGQYVKIIEGSYALIDQDGGEFGQLIEYVEGKYPEHDQLVIDKALELWNRK